MLWDVVEEHLDETGFGFEQFDQLSEHPRLTLADLEKHPEARLLAHLDALEIAGEPIVDRVLVPAVAAPDQEALGRISGAACVLARLGRHALAAPGLGHELPAVRIAAARGLAQGGAKHVLAWAIDRFNQPASAAERSGALEVIAALRAEPPLLLEWLQSDDAALVAAAARAAQHGDPQKYRPVIEYLLEHPAREVREAALIAGLCWESERAFGACAQAALEPAAPSELAMVLLAALGGPRQHARLAEQLQLETARKPALFALGFSGNPTLLPALLEQVRSDDALTSKLAAQAIATITGLDLKDEGFARTAPPAAEAVEAADALPALEDDDLAADLTPAPEDALELPDAAAIARFCEQIAAQLDPRRRYLNGHVFGPEAVLDALERGPLRRRDALALLFTIGTAGQLAIDTRAFCSEQRAQIEAARARAVRSIASRFSSY